MAGPIAASEPPRPPNRRTRPWHRLIAASHDPIPALGVAPPDPRTRPVALPDPRIPRPDRRTRPWRCPIAAFHDLIAALGPWHYPIAAFHDPIAAFHDPITASHDPIPASHDPIAAVVSLDVDAPVADGAPLAELPMAS